jgi:hypothetical protein
MSRGTRALSWAKKWLRSKRWLLAPRKASVHAFTHNMSQWIYGPRQIKRKETHSARIHCGDRLCVMEGERPRPVKDCHEMVNFVQSRTHLPQCGHPVLSAKRLFFFLSLWVSLTTHLWPWSGLREEKRIELIGDYEGFLIKR